ncbi:13394_t:CDS:1, partial [Acaulospora colombiana]
MSEITTSKVGSGRGNVPITLSDAYFMSYTTQRPLSSVRPASEPRPAVGDSSIRGRLCRGSRQIESGVWVGDCHRSGDGDQSGRDENGDETDW